MLKVRPPPSPDPPQLPRSPFLHAVPSTPVDRTGACRFLPCPRGLPRLTGGSASTSFTFGSAQASLALRPARSLARPKVDLCPEAPTQPVTRLGRSVATMSYRQLHGWILLPLVICAVGAHRELTGRESSNRNKWLPTRTSRTRLQRRGGSNLRFPDLWRPGVSFFEWPTSSNCYCFSVI